MPYFSVHLFQGRGIFHNEDKSFLVWVNEEDHISLISVEEGSDVGKALVRVIRGLKVVFIFLSRKRWESLRYSGRIHFITIIFI